MTAALHSGPTWVLVIAGFLLGVFLPRLLGRLLHAGLRLADAIQYWGGRLVLISFVVGAVYLGVRAVA